MDSNQLNYIVKGADEKKIEEVLDNFLTKVRQEFSPGFCC